MKFYKLYYDMDSIDQLIQDRKNYIFAEDTNIDDVEYPNIYKGFFNTIIYNKLNEIVWPEITFYYSSLASNRESDYLLNIVEWPIVHKKVKASLEREGIKGIRFYRVNLCDVVTEQINYNYYLMYIENFIDAYDLEKSNYIYNEEFDMYTFIPKQIFLNHKNCRGYDIFRCKKDEIGIYVSERFYNIIKKNNFTCFYFEEQP